MYGRQVESHISRVFGDGLERVNSVMSTTYEFATQRHQLLVYIIFKEGYEYVSSPLWHEVKFIDDGKSRQLLFCRMARATKERVKVENCCFRTLTVCGRDKNGDVCNARDQAYKNRPKRSSASRHDERREQKLRRMLEQNEACRTAQSEAEDKRKICERWKGGFCQRGKCSRKHGSEQEAKLIECASVEGSKNYDAYYRSKGSHYACTLGESCIFSHVLIPAGEEQQQQ